jgi:hypothetical protein
LRIRTWTRGSRDDSVAARRNSRRPTGRIGVALACLLTLFLAASSGAAQPTRTAIQGVPDQAFATLGPFGVDQTGRPDASGRVEDVEADPFVRQRLLALSDAAVWVSLNGGANWVQTPGLVRFGQSDFGIGSLAFDPEPMAAGVVLLSSPVDRRQPSFRGVYRSIDGGLDWSQPAHYQPTCPNGGIGNPTQIAFFSHHAYVAAGCVVGTSADDGADWTWSAPNTDGWFSGVATDTVGNVFACGNDGIFEKRGGAAWRQVIDFTNRGIRDGWIDGSPNAQPTGLAISGDPASAVSSCRITASPVQAQHVFFTARWQGLTVGQTTGGLSAVFEAYVDAAGRWHWQDLKGGSHNNDRESVVETRPVFDGFRQVGFDLYWNSTDVWYFQRCTLGVAFECTPGASNDENHKPNNLPWTPLGYPDGAAGPGGLHADAGRILFRPFLPECIWLVATDGGLQKPSGNQSEGNDACLGTTKDWTYSNIGIRALEPFDTSITSILGSTAATDVYAAAQDVGGYALLAGQTGWLHADPGNDGFTVDATPVVRSTQLKSIHVYYKGDAAQWIAERGLSNLALALFDPFFNPPDPSRPPQTFPFSGLNGQQQMSELSDGRLVLAVAPSGSGPSTAQTALFLSGDGDHWSRLGGLLLPGRVDPAGNIGEGGSSVLATGSATAPVLFVRSFGQLYRVDGAGLTNVQPLLAGDATHPPDDVGAYAVADPQHLLVYSCPGDGTCASGSVETSVDAGTTWQTLDTVTYMAQSDGFGGHYPIQGVSSCRDAECGQIMSVAISPTNPDVMAVGTRDTGLYESSDAGRSWLRVGGFLAPNLISLRFDLFGRLFVTSHGLGLFRLTPTPSQLHLTRHQRILRTNTNHWTATALSNTGAPLSEVPITFTLTTNHGLVIPLGTVTTTSAGLAPITFRTPPGLTGTVTLHAAFNGQGNDELATEEPFSG